MEKKDKEIEYPYMPEGREIKYVPAHDEFMKMAREFAQNHSLDKVMPNACVIVRDGAVIAMGANGSTFHENNPCERIIQGVPTGQGYELCEGCHPKNHGEQSAINYALLKGLSTQGADIYLWGHWWCCKPCWDAMIAAGIKDVYLLEGSEILFDKNNAGNIVGRQFEATEV